MGLLSALGGIAGSFFGGPIGGAIGSALGGAIGGSESVGQASQVQQQSAQAGIDEQRRQFDAIQKLLQPYTEAGAGALTQQQALLGMGTPGAQQQAITALQGSPQFQALQQQGENAILQNASATGGLRGGNVQGALAQFRPALLSSLIDQQYSRLGGLTSIGQNAAAGVGNAGMSTGANVANLLGRQGQAQAGGILGQQSALSGGINQAFGAIQGAGGFGQLFGRTPPAFNAPGQGFFSGAQSADVGF
jgi:hypothetical protein